MKKEETENIKPGPVDWESEYRFLKAKTEATDRNRMVARENISKLLQAGSLLHMELDDLGKSWDTGDVKGFKVSLKRIRSVLDEAEKFMKEDLWRNA